MKIVQILASSGGIGGLEQHTFNLCNQLALSEEVHVITHPCYAEYFNSAVHFHAVDMARSRWNWRLLWRLKRLVTVIQPDIIHAQAGKASELIANIKMLFGCGQAKIICTIHGTKKNKKAYLKGDAVIAVSKALADGIPEEKAHIIYNGVYRQPESLIHEKKQLKQSIDLEFPDLDSNKKVVMCIGRLAPVKNIALLIQAMQGINANLWIVGEGVLHSTLEAQVQQLQLHDQVAFLGFRTDVGRLIQLADVVALSSDREGFPLVMVEALQANKVMASTKVNGVIEWLPDAYLSEIGDVQDLHRAIQQALAESAQLDFQHLFLRAKAELTVEAMAAQTLQVYQQQLN